MRLDDSPSPRQSRLTIEKCRPLDKIKTLLAGPCIALCLCATAQSETLENAVQEAILKDPRVWSSQAQLGATIERVELARQAQIPQLYANSGVGAYRSDSVTTRAIGNSERFYSRKVGAIGANWVFADFGATAGREASAIARVKAAESRVARTEQTSIQDVIDAYLELWRANELINIANESRDYHTTLTRILGQRVNADATSRAKYEDMAGRRAQIDEDIGDLQIAKRKAEENFRVVVGRLPVDQLETPRGALVVLKGVDIRNVEALVEEGLKTHPEMVLGADLVSAARSEVESAKAGGRPTLSVDFRHGFDDFNPVSSGGHSIVRDTGAMVRANWTLYGSQTKERTREAEQMLTQISSDRDRTAREVERVVRLAVEGIIMDENLLLSIHHPSTGRIQYAESVAAAAKSVVTDISKRDEDIFRASETQRNYAAARSAEINVMQRKIKTEYVLAEALGRLKEAFLQPTASRNSASR